jgi:hypothetical protein
MQDYTQLCPICGSNNITSAGGWTHCNERHGVFNWHSIYGLNIACDEVHIPNQAPYWAVSWQPGTEEETLIIENEGESEYGCIAS